MVGRGFDFLSLLLFLSSLLLENEVELGADEEGEGDLGKRRLGTRSRTAR